MARARRLRYSPEAKTPHDSREPLLSAIVEMYSRVCALCRVSLSRLARRTLFGHIFSQLCTRVFESKSNLR